MPYVELKAEGTSSRAKTGRWSDGIAIVGIGLRFPGVRTISEFWKKLEAGESFVSTLTEEELRAAGVDETVLLSRDYVRRGSRLEDAEYFDVAFFGFTRREAEITDPQHRVFLETAWEALENSGYTGDGARIGVYAGVSMNSYAHQLFSRPDVLEAAGGYQLMLGNDKDFIATRVAYKLNLRGPAVVVQTACSTSLAAVHLACQSILANECEMALAGGVSIPFPQNIGYPYIPGMILSPDGYCRPFDKDAKGTAPGRGAGVVVLKRLSQAIEDEDSIYAVIRGSAWNNDGAQKIGYTAPSIEGQSAVIREAQRIAGITADRIGYIEAHGTATELGDPIEFAALSEVFAGVERGSCVLGALKANLGHSDVAAGVAGLIKAALVVQAGSIPPTPNFKEASPALELEKSPFVISSSKISWKDEGERWAGVSSFGIGGTNVHVVLGSAPQKAKKPEEERARVFPISARTAGALASARERLAGHIEENPAIDLAAVASTLQMGRRTFEKRQAFVAKSMAELISKLREPVRESNTSSDAGIVFLFPGQGQQFVGMAAGLYQSDAAFRKIVGGGAELAQDEFGIDLLSVIAGQSTAELEASIKNTSFAQPLLFLTEYALATRWRELGVHPDVLLGHSLGELTAATVAGVFSFEDGLRLAVHRGKLMEQTPAGAMLAVSLSADAIAQYSGPDIWLAAENAPRLSVVSGAPAAIAELEHRLSKDRVASVRLASRNAFHTPLMAEAAKAFREKVAAVERKAPVIPWLSNVSGTWIDPVEAQSPQYWANQILSRVRFAKCASALGQQQWVFLEAGPGDTLATLLRHQLATVTTLPSLGSLNRTKGDDIIFLESAARLWEMGIDLTWQELRSTDNVRRIPLPTYPFERKKYWVEKKENQEKIKPTEQPEADHEVLEITTGREKRPDISSWFYMPQWQNTPPASVMASSATAGITDSWLVLLDGSGFGRMLVERLEQAGATVCSVSMGQEFVQNGRQFSIHPKERGDYERLCRELAALEMHPAGLICLWTIGEAAASSFDSLVLLLQSGRVSRQPLIQIEIVTDGLEQVLDEPVRNLGAAEALGLIRAVAVEFPETRHRFIDVNLLDGNMKRTVDQVISELRLPGDGLTIACRGNSRWQKGWAAAPLQKPSRSLFRKDGVYLITGGVGGIGYVIARHLLQQYGARVVLTGRTPFPSRGLWDAWVHKFGAEDNISRRILRMQELERLGGQVEFVTADVTDRVAMEEAVTKIRESYGRIDGVIHAAGLLGGATIHGLDLADAAKVRRPKVQGSMVLAELLQGSGLDFFLLCSSISASFPGMGQSSYAAGNTFQNYFATFCRSAYGLPAVAIDFDVWNEVGMAVEMKLPEEFEEVREAWMRNAMTPEEGVEVVERVLGGWAGPVILTSTAELKLVSRPAPRQDTSTLRTSELAMIGDPELAAVIEIWQELLAVETVQVTDNFFELGGHSLLGTMVLSRVRERLGVVLTMRALFEAPTPESLAEQIRISRDRETVVVDTTLNNEEREEFEI